MKKSKHATSIDIVGFPEVSQVWNCAFKLNTRPHVFPANSITGLFLHSHVPLPQTANARTA